MLLTITLTHIFKDPILGYPWYCHIYSIHVVNFFLIKHTKVLIFTKSYFQSLFWGCNTGKKVGISLCQLPVHIRDTILLAQIGKTTHTCDALQWEATWGCHCFPPPFLATFSVSYLWRFYAPAIAISLWPRLHFYVPYFSLWQINWHATLR